MAKCISSVLLLSIPIKIPTDDIQGCKKIAASLYRRLGFDPDYLKQSAFDHILLHIIGCDTTAQNLQQQLIKDRFIDVFTFAYNRG